MSFNTTGGSFDTKIIEKMVTLINESSVSTTHVVKIVDFSGTTTSGNNSILLPSGQVDALSFREGTDQFLTFNTTADSIIFHKSVTFSSITLGTIVISGTTLDYTSTTTAVNEILIPDNTADAFSITEKTGSEKYITFKTTDGSNEVIIQKPLTINGVTTINGNMTVVGTTTSIDTVDLRITDCLIELCKDNITNSMDTGFYSRYSNDGGTTLLYTGLVKDQDDSKWKLFNAHPSVPGTSGNDFSSTLADLDLRDLTVTRRILTDADNNILFGTSAGSDITSGTGNVFIGNSAGSTTTTQSNVIAIGTSSVNATADSAVIGNSSITSFRPGNDATCDLGLGSAQWRHIYLSGTLTFGGASPSIALSVNQADGFSFTESGSAYMTFVTDATNALDGVAAERIELKRKLAFPQAQTIQLLSGQASGLVINDTNSTYLTFDTRTGGNTKVTVSQPLHIASTTVFDAAGTITVIDDSATSLVISEAANAYLTIDTSNTIAGFIIPESVTVGKPLKTNGHLSVITSVTGTGTTQLDEQDSFVRVSSMLGLVTLKLPQSVNSVSQRIVIVRDDATANTLTVVVNDTGSNTIDNGSTTTFNIDNQYDKVELQSDGSGKWYTV